MENFEFTASCSIVCGFSKDGKSKLKESSTHLRIPETVEASAYFLPNGTPTADGIKVMANCFIQGLLGAIRAGHELGYQDESSALRWTISEIERAFVSIHTLETGTQS